MDRIHILLSINRRGALVRTRTPSLRILRHLPEGRNQTVREVLL
jgi:hypothetical protein